MYQLKEKSEIIKEHISDHEFSLLRPYQQALYEPYVRKTDRPESNFSSYFYERETDKTINKQ